MGPGGWLVVTLAAAVLPQPVLGGHGAAGASESLLLLSAEFEAPAWGPLGEGVARQRVARIDWSRVADLSELGAEELRVRFFDDAEFSVRLTRERRHGTGSGTTWLGRTRGAEAENVVLVVGAGGLSMDIFDSGGAVYRVRPIIGDRLLIEQRLAEDEGAACEVVPVPLPVGAADGPEPVTGCEDGSHIDLMVVYTEPARYAAAARLSQTAAYGVLEDWGAAGVAAEGQWDLDHDGAVGITDFLLVLANWTSETHIQNAIDVAVARANLALVNSDVPTEFRLVHRTVIGYVEDGASCYTTLDRLRRGADGYMDDIHELREAYRADIVSLLTTACTGGIAYLMSPQRAPTMEAWAFNAMGDFVDHSFLLAHEVGHNLGCCHALGDGGGCSPSSGLYSFSKGYRFSGPDDLQYRTVMAYTPGLAIPHFSSPAVLYAGYATGVPEGEPGEADNALTIALTASAAANFREDCAD